jgi:uridylate kinase
MDSTAVAPCRENGMPIRVFGMQRGISAGLLGGRRPIVAE